MTKHTPRIGARPRRSELSAPDRQLWERPEVRAILAERDIAALFALLQRHGFSQRRIAALVDMSQSEISEIRAGRKVSAYDVLTRIAEGLGIPLVYLGLTVPPPVWETAQPISEPDPSPAEPPGCMVLRFAVAALAGGDGLPDVAGTLAARCGVSPCAARLLAALTAGLAADPEIGSWPAQPSLRQPGDGPTARGLV